MLRYLASAALFAVALSLVGGVVAPATGQPPELSAEIYKQLQQDVGTWVAETTVWVTPDAPPAKSTGSEVNKMFGTYWVASDFNCDIAGMPYQGRGYFGYDPVGKKYVGTWIDTMSPYLSVMQGNLDDKGVLTMLSKGRDPMSGEVQTSKMVSSYTDDDHRKFEMYAPVPGQQDQWWKMMEVNYTRKK